MENTKLTLTMFRGCEDSGDGGKENCETKSFPLSDYQKASIDKGAMKPEIGKLTPAEINRINKEFPPVPPPGEMAGAESVYYSKDAYATPLDGDAPTVARDARG